MKVKDLIALLQNQDQDAEIVIAGFETVCSKMVAQPDMVIPCLSVAATPDCYEGNRQLSTSGEPSVWIGWSGDYRTEGHRNVLNNQIIMTSNMTMINRVKHLLLLFVLLTTSMVFAHEACIDKLSLSD
ncbi:hypothetical protein L9F31_004252 [Klebsiella pneumoniae]|nr:hypothetical protein [Klebsiella pneumoniae]